MNQGDAPGEASARWRPMPGCDWASLAEAAAPIAIDAVAGEMYIDTDWPDATQAAPQEAPRSVEEAVTLELQLSDDLEPSELERRRRTFAYRNHPDRFGPAHQAWALRRMTVANVLIDQALKTARSRAR